MLKRLGFLVLFTALIGVSSAGAQQPPATPLPAAAPPPPATTQPVAVQPQAAPTPAPAPPPRVFGQPVSIRIDLTVTDQMGSAAPLKKTVTMLAADGERASVRSRNQSRSYPGSPSFNVDVKPILTQEGRIRLDLSMSFDAGDLGNDKEQSWATNLQESMGVIVDNGKPMVISQSADARTDRKVTVEVKATVVK